MPQSSKTKKAQKTGNTTKGTKYVFNVDDYVKVMDHIQNDIVGLEPKNWDPTNQIKNVQKYCSGLIRYVDENTERGLQSSKTIQTLIVRNPKITGISTSRSY